MSDRVPPESSGLRAFRELETLVHHLGDELAGFRRRALVAEARLRELEEQEARPEVRQEKELMERCSRLEQENAALKGRVEAATARTRQMLDRVRFIRQQTQAGAGGER
jgi:multidrug efflux pump subunit AcrA (membrane-fusion protein)